MFKTANYVEAVLWLAIGLAFGARALLKRNGWRTECGIAALAFVLFGVSDIVEATTGAWWRPWWLLIWKAACLCVFLRLFADWRRQRSA